jgi:phage FluMu protein Com
MKNNYNSFNIKNTVIRTFVGFYARKAIYNLDKTLNQDDNYSENISVRCDRCKFLNSFSFIHKSIHCIKCNSPLSPSQIESAISYNMKSQFHSNQNSSQVNNNTWSDVNVTS